MRILILNWRDIKNNKSGGAEILTHECAKRWVADGHEVVQISEKYDGGLKEEIIDGVKIRRMGSADIRKGGVPVQAAAFWWYLKKKRENFDVVIDEIHGIPFFTPFYVKGKKVALICEVADKIWDVIFPFPLNILGKFVERNYFKFYKKNLFLTISEASRKELIMMGVERKKAIVVPMGITIPDALRNYQKEKHPTIIFVARLSKAKGIEDAIHMIKIIAKTFPDIVLQVVGRGDDKYTKYLIFLSKKLGVSDRIKFYGYISEKEKFNMLSTSHILISPSMKEGFGLTIAEAGFVGTPSVVYNSSGLSEVVEDRKTGLICKNNTPSDLAKHITILLRNKTLYDKLSSAAKEKSKQYDWNKTADFIIKILKKL